MPSTPILVFNCGSSSIKFAVVDVFSGKQAVNGVVENIFSDNTHLRYQQAGLHYRQELPKANYQYSINVIINHLQQHKLVGDIKAIGHRVVHGGKYFTSSTIINDDVIERVRSCIPLAPLHNAANVQGIEMVRQAFSTLSHVAVFDTAFHQTLPELAYLYPVPYEWYEKHDVRRYGFHGISHQFVAGEAAKQLKVPLENSAFISAHLGNGCSLAAIKNGKSVDTTMGFTPLEGLMMGTRCGSIDPGIIEYIAHRTFLSLEDVTTLLNKKSGLLGVSGISMDMRTLTEQAHSGNQRAALAIELFCFRLAKHIASMIIPLGALTALIFTGGIGQYAANVREKTLAWLNPLGFTAVNNHNETHGANNHGIITQANSPIAMVVSTNEEWAIAQDVWRIVSVQ